MFYSCVDYIWEKRPDIFLLENVTGLLTHDQGSSFAKVVAELDSIGGDAKSDGSWRSSYELDYFVLNSLDFGPQQNRRRLFIIGRRKGAVSSPLAEIVPTQPPKALADILDDEIECEEGPPLTDRAREVLDATLGELRSRGHDPDTECWAIDV